MEKLTFKQYLESKEQLREAIKNTPVSIVEYEVRKYCSLPVGETEQEKTLISLKPKQKIIVEWRYDHIDNPTPEYILISGCQTFCEDEKQQTYWTGTKLQKWLLRYTKQGENNGYKTT